MVNKQRMIRVIAVIALCMVAYTLRPMPEYALHARTAAGLYDENPVEDKQILSIQQKLSFALNTEMLSALGLLDVKPFPAQAMPQLAFHLKEMNNLTDEMYNHLVEQFGGLRVSKMISLPTWAGEILVIKQVVDQHRIYSDQTKLDSSKLLDIKGNLLWLERALEDLDKMIRKELPTATRSTTIPQSIDPIDTTDNQTL